jgi:dimethylamine monooxygenase subunit B
MAELPLRVAALADGPGGVRSFELTASGNEPLPSFSPGSHLLVNCGGVVNAYSLTGPLIDPDRYEFSVRPEPAGRGGSAWLHRLAVGAVIDSSRPRTNFAVPAAGRLLLIAGGIGVTAILSQLRGAVLRGADVEVLYGHRPGHDVHARQLRELSGDRVTEYIGRASLQVAICSALAHQPLDTRLAVCGPAGLLRFVADRAGEFGWPTERLHYERFTGVDPAPGRPVRLRLARSGREVLVPAGVSVLDALGAAGVEVSSQCRQGVCGECRLPVTSGRIDHRDSYLTASEAAAGDVLLSCVSRSLDDELELDL